LKSKRIKAKRSISTGQLHTLLYFHTQPINVLVLNESSGNRSSRET